MTPAAEPVRFGGWQTFRSLSHRDFRLLWIGSLFSGCGQWIQLAVIGWLTYELTGSAFLLGAINGAKSLPLLFFGPFGGLAADRLDRRNLMMTAQLSLAVASAVFAALIISKSLEIWHLFALTLFTGTCWAFNMPVRQSSVPLLVPRRDLMNAVALAAAGFNITRIVGPSLAGLMIVFIGPGETFFVQAIAFVGVALMVWQVRFPTVEPGPRQSVIGNLTEGAVFIWRHPTLRVQMILALAPWVLGFPYVSLLPIFAADVLNVGAEGYGLMMAAPGVGAVIGTLALASLGDVAGKGRLLVVTIAGFGLTLVLFALCPWFVPSLLILALLGAVQMIYIATNQTLIQLLAPDHLRGRVMGVYMLSQGLLPLGSLFVGTLAAVTSAPTAVLVAGLLVLLLAAGVWIGSPVLRRD